MILATFTIFHVLISLVAIASGFVVVWAMLTARNLDGWTWIFLTTTVATSVTGYFFPVHRLMPSHVVGFVSLIVLSIAIFARYRRHLAGHWQTTYAITATIALYLNFFVLIFQLFTKVPVLKSLAPTQSEPPFAITQLSALVLFAVLAVASAVRLNRARHSDMDGARSLTAS